MDCERLDELAIDLVDPEGAEGLEPRARREADEHLASCTRCTALVERLQRGMKAAAQLPMEDVSSLLEARVLAAASAARPAPSFPRRVARAISTTGRWAMRPQVAMAAVLVVMVGTSVVLLRGGGLPSRRTKVTEEGTPVATLELPAQEPGGAPGIIGGEKKPDPEPAKPKEAPPKVEATNIDGVADLPKLAEKADKPAADDDTKTETKAKAKDLAKESEADETIAQAGGGAKGGAPKAMAPPPAAAAPAAPPADYGGMGGAAEGKAESSKKTAGAAAGPMPAPTSTAAPTTPPSAATYDDAMTAYKEARYPAAAKGFEASASAGIKPSSSWLYAARSYRASGSCVQALPRFQKVVTGYGASPEAPYAALEGGQCAKATGDVATARTLFEKAKTSSVTQKQAEAELAALNAPAQPPAKAKAAKPSSAVDSSY